MKKYDISEDFGFYSRFIPPFNDAVVKYWKKLIKNSCKILKHYDDIECKKIDLGGFYAVLISPKGKEKDVLPCIVVLHGGAFVFPSHTSHYRTAVNYVKSLGAKVVLVNYRTAPENPYPVPENDCKKALSYIVNNANTLGIDVDKIAVAGDSAGGNLAAKVGRYAREKGIKLCCQAYFYPVTDPDENTESKKSFTDTPMWNATLNEKMWHYYFNGKTEKEANYEKIFSPKFNLSTAPAFIETCEFDCLRDEGKALYDYFLKNNVKAEYNLVKNAMHGYEIKDTEITENAFQKRADFFKKYLLTDL